jgi:hypothetical protein
MHLGVPGMSGELIILNISITKGFLLFECLYATPVLPA